MTQNGSVQVMSVGPDVFLLHHYIYKSILCNAEISLLQITGSSGYWWCTSILLNTNVHGEVCSSFTKICSWPLHKKLSWDYSLSVCPSVRLSVCMSVEPSVSLSWTWRLTQHHCPSTRLFWGCEEIGLWTERETGGRLQGGTGQDFGIRLLNIKVK